MVCSTLQSWNLKYFRKLKFFIKLSPKNQGLLGVKISLIGKKLLNVHKCNFITFHPFLYDTTLKVFSASTNTAFNYATMRKISLLVILLNKEIELQTFGIL